MQQPATRTVLDLEADSLHRHSERLCLIQYADVDGVELIDPLCIEDMRPFVLWMEETQIWMHGADYDMSLLLQSYGALPAMILDTQVAARLLGYKQFGLAGLVEQLFGVVLSKKNQKADWGKRPISPSMEEYAKSDVIHMLPMADIFVAALQEKGRHGWFMECCESLMEKARQRHANPDTEPWRIKGSGRLNGRGLAALRALWTWRDREAAAWDKPSFMVCSNNDLLEWSNALQQFRTVGAKRNFHQQRSQRFYKVIDQFHAMDEEDYPKRPKRVMRRIDDQFETRVESWLEKRNAICEELDIEVSLLATRNQVEAIALDEEQGMGELMNWQRELFAR